MTTEIRARLVTYNVGQGGSRDPSVWARVLPALAPDLLFVQESRSPAESWLGSLPGRAHTDPWGNALHRETVHWELVPGGKWGSGLWVRDGHLTPLPVAEPYRGRVAAAIIEGRVWPGTGEVPIVALSVHAPTRKGSSYIKEVGFILDMARDIAGGHPLILAGDFNVAVGLRSPDQPARSLINSRGERDLIRRLREEFDMVPCWQSAHPGEPLARTLRWMYRSDSLPYHCDGLFIPAAWSASLQSCDVLEDATLCALSDHNPVVASLSFAPVA